MRADRVLATAGSGTAESVRSEELAQYLPSESVLFSGVSRRGNKWPGDAFYSWNFGLSSHKVGGCVSCGPLLAFFWVSIVKIRHYPGLNIKQEKMEFSEAMLVTVLTSWETGPTLQRGEKVHVLCGP